MNASFAMTRASSGEAVTLFASPCACAPAVAGTPPPTMLRPSAIALMRVENFIESPFLLLRCRSGLLAEGHVETREYRKLRYARAGMGDGVRRFDERVVDGRTAFPRLAGAEADRDVVCAVLQVERPCAGGADVPATRKIEN